jgi:hypothetical protein
MGLININNNPWVDLQNLALVYQEFLKDAGDERQSIADF